jgi:threonine/homoserine/homoserine lactone efflux protein
MLEQILLGSGFAFAAAVQPGPLQAYLIAQTLTNGFRRTVPATFAPILSDIPIAALVLLVLTSVPPELVLALQFIGGSFLLYLAYGAYRSFRHYQQTPPEAATTIRQSFFKAVLVNLLNPNAYLGWGLVMGPLVASAWRQAPAYSVAVICAFYITMISATLVILALFGQARATGPRLARALVGLSSAALCIFALYQIWNGTMACLRMLGA